MQMSKFNLKKNSLGMLIKVLNANYSRGNHPPIPPPAPSPHVEDTSLSSIYIYSSFNGVLSQKFAIGSRASDFIFNSDGAKLLPAECFKGKKICMLKAGGVLPELLGRALSDSVRVTSFICLSLPFLLSVS